MRAIRRCAAAVLLVCGATTLIAIRGEIAVAHKAALPPGDPQAYAGFAEGLLELLLSATGILLFASILILWLIAALRRSEWGWATGAAFVLAGSVAFPVAVYTYGAFVLSASGLGDHVYMLLLLLVFVPLLAGLVPAAIYGFRPQEGSEQVRLAQSQPRLDSALMVLVLGVVLLGYVAWQLQLGFGIAFLYVDGPLVGAYFVPLGTALALSVAMATTLRARRANHGAWAAGLGGLTLVGVALLVIAMTSAELVLILVSLAVSMMVLPLVVLAYGIFVRRRHDGAIPIAATPAN